MPEFQTDNGDPSTGLNDEQQLQFFAWLFSDLNHGVSDFERLSVKAIVNLLWHLTGGPTLNDVLAFRIQNISSVEVAGIEEITGNQGPMKAMQVHLTRELPRTSRPSVFRHTQRIAS